MKAKARDLILGPCPCERCGVLVWWTGVAWVGASRKPHRCVTA